MKKSLLLLFYSSLFFIYNFIISIRRNFPGIYIVTYKIIYFNNVVYNINLDLIDTHYKFGLFLLALLTFVFTFCK